MTERSYETIRRATRLMRKRGPAARAGRWVADGGNVRAVWRFGDREVAVGTGSLEQGNAANAEYIASMGPRVGTDFAYLLNALADRAEEMSGSIGSVRVAESVCRGSIAGYEWALIAARTYLGEPQDADTAGGDAEDECDGHESLAGEHMGEAVYCDGSCKTGRRR